MCVLLLLLCVACFVSRRSKGWMCTSCCTRRSRLSLRSTAATPSTCSTPSIRTFTFVKHFTFVPFTCRCSHPLSAVTLLGAAASRPDADHVDPPREAGHCRPENCVLWRYADAGTEKLSDTIIPPSSSLLLFCFSSLLLPLVSGVDLCFGRYDTKEHVLSDPGKRPLSKASKSAQSYAAGSVSVPFSGISASVSSVSAQQPQPQAQLSLSEAALMIIPSRTPTPSCAGQSAAVVMETYFPVENNVQPVTVSEPWPQIAAAAITAATAATAAKAAHRNTSDDSEGQETKKKEGTERE
jgi:hypothetical protein